MQIDIRKIAVGLSLTAAAGLACAEGPACVRGEPEPLLRSQTQGVTKQRFQRLSDHEAVEELTLRHGDRIRLTHGGCESFVITFTIHSRQARGDRLQMAAQGLRQLSALKPNAVFDLSAAAAEMEGLHRAGRQAPDGQEFLVTGDGEDFLQTRLVFERAPRGAVSFSLLKGPL